MPPRVIATSILLLAACGLASSCTSTSPPPSTQPAAKQALDDPMNYSPKMDDADVTGGKIDEFNKDAFKRDLDHVFNP